MLLDLYICFDKEVRRFDKPGIGSDLLPGGTVINDDNLYESTDGIVWIL